MAILESSIGVQVESIFFPPSVKPLGATNTFFLGGAGVRGKMIEGTFVKVTGHGVYLEDKAISSLANKWKGKSVEELMDSDEFYRDIVIGPFEKFAQVAMIRPLTGKDFSEKVSQSCIEVWKSFGIYTEEADAKIIDEFLEIFKDQNFPPGSSFLFKILLDKSLMISFSKDGGIPEVAQAVIENGKLGETILESMIGKLGVSPATKQSLAIRLFNLMNPKANN